MRSDGVMEGAGIVMIEGEAGGSEQESQPANPGRKVRPAVQPLTVKEVPRSLRVAPASLALQPRTHGTHTVPSIHLRGC